MKATGVGSLPGDDIDAALAAVFDDLPDFPHLPELPGRGPGADLTGRTAAVLVDLHVDLQPSGWRLVPRAGMDERRAAELLERDLDALVPVAAGFDGTMKVQLAGPWTLAATLQTERGPVLADAGAVRDLVASLAEGVTMHLAEVRRRVPAAQLTLQLDEPALPAVLAGAVPTSSGLSRVRAVPAADAEQGLAAVVAAAATSQATPDHSTADQSPPARSTSALPVVVHCCARDVPITLVRGAGAAAVSVDLGSADLDRDALGEALEAGFGLWAGLVPALGPGVPPTPAVVVEPLRRLWSELGFGPERLVEQVVVTPACGLAGASQGWARTAMRLARQAARILAEAPEAARR